MFQFPIEAIFRKAVTFTGNVFLPANVVGDKQFKTGDPLDSDKQQHLHKLSERFGLAIGDTPAAKEVLVHVAESGDEVIRVFKAALNGAISNTDSVSFDLKVNGSSVLSSAITITSGEGTAVQEATIQTPDLSAGDKVSIAMSVSGTPDGTGPVAWCELDADPTT